MRGTSLARFGIISVLRSVPSAVDDAKLAEAVGFNLYGVADRQSVFRETRPSGYRPFSLDVLDPCARM